MRFTAFALLTTAALVAAQSQVNQPLTTNNAQSACVEFGDCTQDPNNTFATATQNAPVTSPASSDALPPPTDAAQSSAYIASLASAGALSAYNSRVANGQPTGVNEPDGATSPLTGTVIAQPPPTSTSAKGTNDSDASIGPLSIGWTSFAAPAVVALATVFGAALVI